jgi:CelD/BcsL family acetyltransferase involved in cellulose biosynthesis
MKEFDQGFGDEDYKKEYCDVTIALHQIETPRTARGRAGLLARKVKMSLRGTFIWEPVRTLRTTWRKRKLRRGRERSTG